MKKALVYIGKGLLNYRLPYLQYKQKYMIINSILIVIYVWFSEHIHYSFQAN